MVLPLGDVEKTRIVPVATYILIALNCAMFVVELNQGKGFEVSYSATPYEITHAFDITEPVSIVLEPVSYTHLGERRVVGALVADVGHGSDPSCGVCLKLRTTRAAPE